MNETNLFVSLCCSVRAANPLVDVAHDVVRDPLGAVVGVVAVGHHEVVALLVGRGEEEE